MSQPDRIPYEAEERFHLLLDSAAAGIYAVGADGACTFCNRTALELLGYSQPAELVGSQMHGRIHYAHADGTAYLQEECRILSGWLHDARVHVDTEVFWRRDGTSFPVEYWAHPIRRGDEVLGSVVTFVDISERVRIERTRNLVSRAVEQTADSVFITNRDGVIEYVNPAFEALTGFGAGQAVGDVPRLVRSGRHDTRFYHKLWSTVLAGQVFRFVVTNKSKDGRLYDEDQSITPMRDANGEISHFVSTGRDVTQRRRAEEAVRRFNNQLEMQTARIAGVLHDEAGQFLASARAALSQIAHDVSPEIEARLMAVRQHLDQVETQLRMASHELYPKALDDLGLAEAIRTFARTFGQRTGIELTIATQYDRRCPAAIEIVVYRLVQEALANIEAHARASHATVTLTCDGPVLSCSIRDDGEGFDVDARLARAGERGVGLPLIQDRLEALGGMLHITSAPGAGTELRATLPADMCEDPAHPAR